MTTALAPELAEETAPKIQRRTAREKWRLRGPLLPALVFAIIVTQLPFVVTIAVSTLHWNVLRPGEKSFLGLGNYTSFAGLKNYSTVFTDARLRVAVLNTVVLTVASALLWKHALYNPDYGLFNGVLNWIWGIFGAEGPVIDYVSKTPMPAVVAALVWQWTPFMMLILLAGLQSQPGDV